MCDKEKHVKVLKELFDYYHDQYENFNMPNPYDSDFDYYNKCLKKLNKIEEYLDTLDYVIYLFSGDNMKKY